MDVICAYLRMPSNRRPAGVLGGGSDRGVVLGGQVLHGLGVGRVVAVPWWSQSRHPQTTVSTDAIASMLITSVAGRQTVMGVPWVVVMYGTGRPPGARGVLGGVLAQTNGRPGLARQRDASGILNGEG
jgi:hypothetical protein